MGFSQPRQILHSDIPGFLIWLIGDGVIGGEVWVESADRIATRWGNVWK